MKLSCYIESKKDLAELNKSGNVSEVILAPSKWSRFGKLSWENCLILAKESKDLGLKTSLELDRILVGTDIVFYLKQIEELDLNSFDSIRVIDPGLAQYILEETNHKIQWIAEMGNHNIRALKEWESYFGERLDRIILCPELEKSKIKEFTESLDTPTELLGFGRILLFYTPRLLLRPYYNDHDDSEQRSQLSEEFLSLSANSEESPHKGFPIIETNSGTYMFNPKDLCLLDYWDELKETNIDYLRIDLRSEKEHNSSVEAMADFIKTQTAGSLEQLKKVWPSSLIRGFFKANKSDVLFKNLKNQHNQRNDENFIGDILETESGKHSVLEVKSTKKSLSIGDLIQYKTPDKKWKDMAIRKMSNLSGEKIEEAKAGDYVILPHSSGVSSNTRVYWK